MNEAGKIPGAGGGPGPLILPLLRELILIAGGPDLLHYASSNGLGVVGHLAGKNGSVVNLLLNSLGNIR